MLDFCIILRPSTICITLNRKPYILFVIAICCANLLLAQEPKKDLLEHMYPSIVVDGDTMPYVKIDPVVKKARRRFKSKHDMRQYYRMIRNLKKAYPFAQIAKKEILELNQQLINISSSRERKKLIKATEKRLFDQYEKKLTQLTFSQGKMLIKLIKRETGQTTFQVVRELKGGFSAGFWQGIARLFGSSLKLDYDPKGEDALLEELVLLYEQGLL